MNDKTRDTLERETSDGKQTTFRGDIIQDLGEPENQNIDELIEHLPENFPAAAETITEELTPLLIDADEGVKDHYITLIKKKTNAASKQSVKVLIQDAIKKMNEAPTLTSENEPDRPEDPEILERAQEIAKDPQLFKKRVDTIGQLGVEGERKTIGLYTMVIDSAKLPMKLGGSEALAAKNSGPQGSGKSRPLFLTLNLYPQSDYHVITSGSPKSLYNMKKRLKHGALILAEAHSLEGGNGNNEWAYCLRSVLSEGRLKYQFTTFVEGEKVTVVQEMEGPTSLLTTTIRGRLEDQLEDRLIQIHPTCSNNHTHRILSRIAEMASGELLTVENEVIESWKAFHRSLETLDVVVPFVKELSESIKSQSLPTSVHRAFQRVISAIKTVALVYQHQRQKDEEGRVIAEMSDYSIVYQLMRDPFRESIGQLKSYTDKRIQVIESELIISSKGLAERADVSASAISQWMRSWIEKGVLMWCDQFGDKFPDTESLEKAKRSGNSYIRIKNSFGLPSPYGLTRDSRWRLGGELDCTYDLGLDDNVDEDDVLDFGGESPEEAKGFSFSDFYRRNGVQSEGVKVLSGNGGMQNEKMATKVTFVTGDAGETENELTKEFDEVLAQ